MPKGFVGCYGCTMLVRAEEYPTIDGAKAIKKWRRAWKLELIERDNPEWEDLYEHIVG